MYILIYAIAVACALIGMTLSFLDKDLAMLSAGLMAAVLFGALGKVVHLLDMIHEQLAAIRPALPVQTTDDRSA
jgi:hypothetical protein